VLGVKEGVDDGTIVVAVGPTMTDPHILLSVHVIIEVHVSVVGTVDPCTTLYQTLAATGLVRVALNEDFVAEAAEITTFVLSGMAVSVYAAGALSVLRGTAADVPVFVLIKSAVAMVVANVPIVVNSPFLTPVEHPT
jgi:hypothetical protein